MSASSGPPRAGVARFRGALAGAASLALLAPPLSLATPEGPGRIRGSITTETRRPLAGARVATRAVLADRDVLFLTVSDERGSYLVDDLPAGLYRIDVFADGFRPKSLSEVEVRPPFRNILDFRLLPLPTSPLAEPAFSGSGGGTPPIPPGPPLPPVVAPGAAPVDVVGGVTLAGGDAVADAELALTGGPAPGRRLALSTDTGALSLPAVPPGIYDVTITSAGTVPLLIPGVSIAGSRTLEIRAVLVPFPAERAVKREIILPEERPVAPRRWLPVP